MAEDATMLMLHGAGTAAWVWDRVIAEMPINPVAVDVPSRTADATPERCIRDLVEVLDDRGVDSVILVLHSLSGVLAPGLSRALGSRLRQLVYVSGIIPPPGGAFVDALGWANRLILKGLFRLNPSGLKPSPAMIRRELCNDLSEEDARRVVSRYEAEMPGVYLTPVDGAPDRKGCVYVRLLQDRSVPPARQDAMIARLQDPVIHEIDAGHLVMLSQPLALAEILTREAGRLRL